MIARNIVFFCLLVGNLILLAPHDATAARKAATSPGTYSDWGGDIDEVTIIQPFNAAGYDAIAVESFDTAGVALPNPKDNTYPAVLGAIKVIKPAFMAGLEENARRKVDASNPRGTGKGRTLVIRARVTKLDPGSQAARYFLPGAGAVKIALAGEIVDGTTKKTLVRFKQERRSAVGFFGGGYEALFKRTAHQIGGDIAGLVNAF